MIQLISYGEALTTFAFLLAFSQFMTPIMKLRINVKSKWGIKFLFFGTYLSVLFVFISKLLCGNVSFISLEFFSWKISAMKSAFNEWQWFFEILPCLILPIIFSRMIWLIWFPVEVTTKNYNRFLAESGKIISRGNTLELCDLGLEVRSNIGAIIENDKDLDLWTDPLFCKLLVLHNPETAIEFIEKIKHRYLSEAEKHQECVGRAFIHEIVKQAYNHKESILYRESSCSKRFIKIIFGDIKFVESAFDPLLAIGFEKTEASAWKIKKLCEIIQGMCKQYFLSSEFFFKKHPDVLNLGRAFETLNREMQNMIFNDIRIEQKITKDLIHTIDFSLEEIFKIIVNGTEKYIQNFKIRNEMDSEFINNVKKGVGIHYVMANALFQFLENLSWIKENDESAKSLALIWLHYSSCSIGKNILTKLEDKIFERLDYNFHKNAYPSISRPLLTIIGLVPTNETHSWFAEFRKRVHSYIEINFLNAFEKFGPKFLERLPSHILYDQERQVICDKGNPNLTISVKNIGSDHKNKSI